MMRSANVYKVARARSMDHRCLFQAMGMRYRAQIGHVWNMGHEIEIEKKLRSLDLTGVTGDRSELLRLL